MAGSIHERQSSLFWIWKGKSTCFAAFGALVDLSGVPEA